MFRILIEDKDGNVVVAYLTKNPDEAEAGDGIEIRSAPELEDESQFDQWRGFWRIGEIITDERSRADEYVAMAHFKLEFVGPDS